MRVVVYESEDGHRPFEEWFFALPPDHAIKVQAAVGRIEGGHQSGLKTVGEGVHEWRIDWGPGLRIYLAFDGEALVLLLGGGTKRRQASDIAAAQDRWSNYKRRKKRKDWRCPCPGNSR